MEQHKHEMNMDKHGMNMGWGRFWSMIGLSVVLMFGLMYQLVYSSGDLLFSMNRLLASLLMGCIMAIVMLAFMWPMYKGDKAKAAIVVGASLLGMGIFAVNRSQAAIGDAFFMKAMIPHHSIAINNARKAHISDPRVRKLADGIIESQVKEIAEMKMLLEDIKRNGERGGTALPARPAELTPEMEREARAAVE